MSLRMCDYVQTQPRNSYTVLKYTNTRDVPKTGQDCSAIDRITLGSEDLKQSKLLQYQLIITHHH